MRINWVKQVLKLLTTSDNQQANQQLKESWILLKTKLKFYYNHYTKYNFEK